MLKWKEIQVKYDTVRYSPHTDINMHTHAQMYMYVIVLEQRRFGVVDEAFESETAGTALGEDCKFVESMLTKR